MKLYHSTSRENARLIMLNGLKGNNLGIIYLSPNLEKAKLWNGEVILEVETGDCKLTAFEDCADWEVLCWGEIKPENIRML